jgi:trans-aconitate 2-methyltransferase
VGRDSDPDRGPDRYTFGDDDRAGQRLQLVADAYRPTSEPFIRAQAPPGAGSVVVDLGCGPGFSTDLLAETCRPRRLLGIDASPSFVELARRQVPSAIFAVHDASVTPLPGAPADVLYARLLLAHLRDPLDVARRWQSQLAAGGVLLVEDLEDIAAPAGPLRDYEELSTETVRSGGGSMYGGRALAPLGGGCVEVDVPARVAARIYLFNVERWLGEGQGGGRQDRLGRLRAGLADMAGNGTGTVSWIVRQIVLPAL